MNRSRELKVGRLTLRRRPGHYVDFEAGYDRLDILTPEGIFAFYPYTLTTEANTVRYASSETMLMRSKMHDLLDSELRKPNPFEELSRIPPAMTEKPVDKKPDEQYLGNIDDQYQWEF